MTAVVLLSAVAGLLLTASPAASTGFSVGFVGTSQTGNSDVLCPTNAALTGLDTNSDSYVEGIGPVCSTVPLPGQTSRPAGVSYGGGTDAEDNCPAGNALVGVNGRVGLWLDQIQAICRQLGPNGQASGSTSTLTAHGGAGGSPVSASCPGPEVVVGLRIDTDDTDAHIAGLYLACSTLPPPPTFIATNPVSPADNNDPKIIGAGEAGSTVKLYTDPSCAGNPIASNTAANFSSPGISVSVADNSTTTFHATATDAFNNSSPCSLTAITYTEITASSGRGPTTPPGTSLRKHPDRKLKARRKVTVRFAFLSTQPGVSFECSLDKRAFAPCTSPKSYKVGPGTHTFRVEAVNVAGTDPTPSVFRFKVVKKQ